MRTSRIIFLLLLTVIGLSACMGGPKLSSGPMPQTGFLQSYEALKSVPTNDSDARLWRYESKGVKVSDYYAVIIKPIMVNQPPTDKITPEIIQKTRAAIEDAVRKSILSKGNIRIVTRPGPHVARLTVGITGAEISVDGIKPWSLTPIGMAIDIATYLGGVNSKTPALLVESLIADSQTNEVLVESLATIEGSSFRTGSGSIESFTKMATKIVELAISVK